MSRMPKVYQPGGGPLRWQDDVTGVLPSAVKAFLDEGLGHKRCTPEQVELVRDYCEYYINAPCWQLGEETDPYHIAFLAGREHVKTLKSVKELSVWIRSALDLGIDPL